MKTYILIRYRDDDYYLDPKDEDSFICRFAVYCLCKQPTTDKLSITVSGTPFPGAHRIEMRRGFAYSNRLESFVGYRWLCYPLQAQLIKDGFLQRTPDGCTSSTFYARFRMLKS